LHPSSQRTNLSSRRFHALEIFMRHCRFLRTALFAVLIVSLAATAAWEGTTPGIARELLRQVETTLNHDYYDPHFHGVDMEARFADAESAVPQTASDAQAFAVIGLTVDALGDFSTRFVPPHPNFVIRTDWNSSFVGDHCYITAVRPGSGAAGEGLRPGDLLLAVDGYELHRPSFWQRGPASYGFSPPHSVRLTLMGEGGQPRTIDAPVKVTTLFSSPNISVPVLNVSEYLRGSDDLLDTTKPRVAPASPTILVWKVPAFSVPPELFEEGLDRAKKFSSLVLDLRDSNSDNFDRLPHIVSRLFDHKLTLGQLKTRGHSRAFTAGSFGTKAFAGKIIVLSDSRTSGTAEVLARLIQIEKRGIVLGDRTVGDGCLPAFREFGSSQLHFAYGLTLCTAELIMSDGQSLRGRGVTPDTLILPTPADLAAGRDPVLSAAVALLNGSLTPEQAGKLFPVIWLPH
jgi:C-terminal processing protease CtpA/Prc